jgi:DNA-binding MarR family transcriptional regulator
MDQERIIDHIYRAHRYLSRLETEPRDYGTGELLYSSDVHTIMVVSGNPGCNLTFIAESLGISKAAVSKFVLKLIKAKYLTKGRAANNNRDVIFNLTEKGRVAAKGHDRFERKTFGPLQAIEETLSEKEKTIITAFLLRLEKQIKE